MHKTQCGDNMGKKFNQIQNDRCWLMFGSYHFDQIWELSLIEDLTLDYVRIRKSSSSKRGMMMAMTRFEWNDGTCRLRDFPCSRYHARHRWFCQRHPPICLQRPTDTLHLHLTSHHPSPHYAFDSDIVHWSCTPSSSHLEIASSSAWSRSPSVAARSQMSAPQNILPPLGTTTTNVNVPLMHPTTPQDPSSNADPMRAQQPPRPPPPPLDTMRAYRACLNCRNRKSKCDLDINQGRPVSSVQLVKQSRMSRECNLIFNDGPMTVWSLLLRLPDKRTWVYLGESHQRSHYIIVELNLDTMYQRY